MAKMTFDGLYKYEQQLAELGQSVDRMAKYAIYPAAGEVIDALKAATPVDTGDLRDSEVLTRFETTEGAVYTAIAFTGYDRKGVPNVIKARVIESGSSTHPKRPFIRPTVNRMRQQVIDKIASGVDEYINNLMGGK